MGDQLAPLRHTTQTAKLNWEWFHQVWFRDPPSPEVAFELPQTTRASPTCTTLWSQLWSSADLRSHFAYSFQRSLFLARSSSTFQISSAEFEMQKLHPSLWAVWGRFQGFHWRLAKQVVSMPEVLFRSGRELNGLEVSAPRQKYMALKTQTYFLWANPDELTEVKRSRRVSARLHSALAKFQMRAKIVTECIEHQWVFF